MEGYKLGSPESPAFGEKLYVIKRNGQRQEIKFDKITVRLEKLAAEGRPLNVDVVKIAQRVIEGIFAGVKTSDLDLFASEIAAHMTSVHPDYAELAGRIRVSDVHKNIPKTFSDAMEMAYAENWNPYTREYTPLVNDKFLAFVRLHAEQLNAAIDLSYDYTYNAFSSSTLLKSYCLKTQQGKLIETFQYTFMRVAICTSKYDLERALKTYDYLKRKMATHATPTIFNAGGQREQLSSCFLSVVKQDSIEGIYETLKNCALLSKNAGGIGLSLHNIRASNSYIRGTNGTSNGLIPMLRVFNDTAKYVDQCFLGNTFVFTDKGVVCISEVKAGDKVYTSNGTFENVIKARNYPLHVTSEADKNQTLVSFQTASSPLPTTCTEMHPFLVLRTVDDRRIDYEPTQFNHLMDMQLVAPQWIEAQQLSQGDLIAMPLLGRADESSMPSIEYCRQLGSEMERSNGEVTLPSEYLNLDSSRTVALLEGLCGNRRIEEDLYWIDNCTYSFALSMAMQLLRLGYQISYKNSQRFTVSIGIPSLAVQGVQGYQVFVRDEIAWVPIKEVNAVKAIDCANQTSDGNVVLLYDFDVETHHEYLTQGGLAHNGGGKRKGAFAVYLEPWHADIQDFLQQRKGKKTISVGDDGITSPDLFYGLWVPDLFMERVDANGSWSLFCPDEAPGLYDCWGEEFRVKYENYEKEGKARKTMKAQDLWQQIIDSQIETGTPYMLYKDAANSKSNQQHLGTIRSSNLCVAPETKVLTSQGYRQIASLKDQQVEIWNGEQFSPVVVRQTGTNQELIKVVLSNGAELECTKYHKFYIHEDGKRPHGSLAERLKQAVCVEAANLLPGMRLLKPASLPVVSQGKTGFVAPYTHGFFCGDGSYINENRPAVQLYGPKKDLLKYMETYSDSTWMSGDALVCPLRHDLAAKFEVPLEYDQDIRLRWLEGLVDADGCIAKTGKSKFYTQQSCTNITILGTNESLQVASINKTFLDNVRLLVSTLGVDAKVTCAHGETTHLFPDGKGGKKEYAVQPLYRLLITSVGLQKLHALGFAPKRLSFAVRSPIRECSRFITVENVEFTGRHSDTYCFTEPILHLGTFNGVLTGNCTEIILYTSPKEVAVCNLSSFSLPAFFKDGRFDHVTFYDAVRHFTGNLDNIIDINYYPIPEAEYSNRRHRPIGLGVQGFAELCFMLRIPYDSPEAAKLNEEIFETMYYAALSESCHLAETRGKYETYEGSPVSKGILQFDMWNKQPTSGRWDWDALRQKIKKHGIRNSQLLAPMPTATTSTIFDNTEAFEAQTSNFYARQTLSGNHQIVNRFLVRDLLALGLWTEEMRNMIIAKNGSVQDITQIPDHLKAIYKTVWEIKQRVVADMAADRGKYVDQSMSLNVHMYHPDAVELKQRLTGYHFYAWRKGLKTGMYYFRTQGTTDAQQFTVDPSYIKAVTIGKRNGLPIPATTPTASNPTVQVTAEEDGPVCTMQEGCISCGS